MQLEDYLNAIESGGQPEPGTEEAHLRQAFGETCHAWRHHVDEAKDTKA
jgi:hypothetical protein